MKKDLVLTIDEYLDECCVPPHRVGVPSSNARHVEITAENHVDPETKTHAYRCDRWGHPCPDCKERKLEMIWQFSSVKQSS